MLPKQKVRLFVDTTSRRCHDELDELVQELSMQGIGNEDAECLIAFVPMAFAQVLLSPRGVKFQDTFLIKDLETGASAQGTFANEPMYLAALEVAQEMATGDAKARTLFERTAAQSAEYSVAMQLGGSERDRLDIVLTEAMLVRVPIAHVAVAPSGPLRRFWSAIVGR